MNKNEVQKWIVNLHKYMISLINLMQYNITNIYNIYNITNITNMHNRSELLPGFYFFGLGIWIAEGEVL
jgi:hypothetical protein